MTEKHSSPGWFARGTAIVGIVLTALGLVLGYLNYRWQRENDRRQREIQEESTAERILVRLDSSRTIKNVHTLNDLENLKHLVGTGYLPTLDPKGEVGMEITNIGLRPLFIKKAVARVGSSVFPFHEHDPFPLLPNDDPAKTNEATKLLEPSETIRYPLSWDFSDYPLAPNSPMEDMEVEVQTTKNTFSCQHQFVTRIVWAAEGGTKEEGKKFQVKMNMARTGNPSKQPPPCSQGGPPERALP